MCARTLAETALPSESGIADWFDGADLADAFAVDLEVADAAKGIDYLARCVMDDPALWVRFLLAIRDLLVVAFGIKTSGQLRLRAATERVAHIDFFTVLSRSDNEVIVGEDDWHLNFRASVLIRSDRNGRAQLFATTAVRCQNSIGRIYLALITPFHRSIVRASLRRAARKGWRVDEPVGELVN